MNGLITVDQLIQVGSVVVQRVSTARRPTRIGRAAEPEGRGLARWAIHEALYFI